MGQEAGGNQKLEVGVHVEKFNKPPFRFAKKLMVGFQEFDESLEWMQVSLS
jgi:hypothetical protein